MSTRGAKNKNATRTCDIEVWFSGEVSYDTSSRNPEEYDPYWGDSTLFFYEGFIYLIDDEYATVENEVGCGKCPLYEKMCGAEDKTRVNEFLNLYQGYGI